MKVLISFMNTGLRLRSSETVATTAVTNAGIAATSVNSATTRTWSRAPARPALPAAIRLRASSPINTSKMKMINALPQNMHSTMNGVGMSGVNPAKTTKVVTARSKAAPTTSGPKRPTVSPSSKLRAPVAPS